MAIELLKGRRTWFLRLSGTVDVLDAGALHTAALDAVAEAPAGVVVKLEHADRLDTSATQILLALQRALEADGRSMRLEGTPVRMAERWRLAGMRLAGGLDGSRRRVLAPSRHRPRGYAAPGPTVAEADASNPGLGSPSARIVPTARPALDSRRAPTLGVRRRTDN
jgi:anti-anti-sigma regulatory factor